MGEIEFDREGEYTHDDDFLYDAGDPEVVEKYEASAADAAYRDSLERLKPKPRTPPSAGLIFYSQAGPKSDDRNTSCWQLEMTHHGLVDLPIIGELYQHLNHSEAMVLAFGSYWMKTELGTQNKRFDGWAKEDPYDIFKFLNDKGFPIYNAGLKFMTGRGHLIEQHEGLNPYGKNLPDRVRAIDSEHIAELRASLKRNPKRFRFPKQKGKSGAETMTFMPNGPATESQHIYAKRYAQEIAKIVGQYNLNFHPAFA